MLHSYLIFCKKSQNAAVAEPGTTQKKILKEKYILTIITPESLYKSNRFHF